jgi:hypothetical protein
MLRRVDGEKAKPSRSRALDVLWQFQMIGIGAPGAGEAESVKRRLGGSHDLLWCALSAIHLANGLLGEDWFEIKSAYGSKMAGCGQPEPVTKAERTDESERRGWPGFH